eukprot:g4596.t1
MDLEILSSSSDDFDIFESNLRCSSLACSNYHKANVPSELLLLIAKKDTSDRLCRRRKRLARLLEVLLLHSCPLELTRQIFSLFRSDAQNRLNNVSSFVILRLLKRVIAHSHGPSAYLHLTGVNSGMQMPAIPNSKWPRDGYTFFAWVRIEALPSTNSSCTIFSATDSAGIGVTISIASDETLIVESNDPVNGRCTGKAPSAIKLGRWTFIVIVHRKGGELSFEDEISEGNRELENDEVCKSSEHRFAIYLDGKLCLFHKLPYPFEFVQENAKRTAAIRASLVSEETYNMIHQQSVPIFVSVCCQANVSSSLAGLDVVESDEMEHSVDLLGDVIASSDGKEKPSLKPSLIRNGCEMNEIRGQLGVFGILSRPLTPKEVVAIQPAMGTNGLVLCTRERFSTSNIKSSRVLLQSGILQGLQTACVFHPEQWDNSTRTCDCQPCGIPGKQIAWPWKDNDIPMTQVAGKAFASGDGVSLLRTVPIAVSLRRCGGVLALLPLLRCDRNSQLLAGFDDSEGGDSSGRSRLQLVSELGAEAYAQAAWAIGAMVDRYPRQRRHFMVSTVAASANGNVERAAGEGEGQWQGVRCLAALLLQAPTSHLSLELFKAIRTLVGSLGKGFDSFSRNELAASALRREQDTARATKILFDLRIWAHASGPVQVEVFKILLRRSSKLPPLHSVGELLDVIRWFYWQFERHETALERRSELKEDVIVALRRNVFALVERCIIFDYYKEKRKRERKYNRSDQNNISTDKTHKLATAALNAALLLDFIADESLPSNDVKMACSIVLRTVPILVLRHHKKVASRAWYSLLGRKDEKLRIMGLRLLSRCLAKSKNNTAMMEAKTSLIDRATNMVSATIRGASTPQKSLEENVSLTVNEAKAIEQQLNRVPITIALWRKLTLLLFGALHHSLDEQACEMEERYLLYLRKRKIKHIQLLPAMLGAVASNDVPCDLRWRAIMLLRAMCVVSTGTSREEVEAMRHNFRMLLVHIKGAEDLGTNSRGKQKNSSGTSRLSNASSTSSLSSSSTEKLNFVALTKGSYWKLIISLIPQTPVLNASFEKLNIASLPSTSAEEFRMLKDDLLDNDTRIKAAETLAERYGKHCRENDRNLMVGVFLQKFMISSEDEIDGYATDSFRLRLLGILAKSFPANYRKVIVESTTTLLTNLLLQCLITCRVAVREFEEIRGLLICFHSDIGAAVNRRILGRTIKAAHARAMRGKKNTEKMALGSSSSASNNSKDSSLGFGLGHFFTINAMHLCAAGAEEILVVRRSKATSWIDMDSLLELTSMLAPLIARAVSVKSNKIFSIPTHQDSMDEREKGDGRQVLQWKPKPARKAAGIQHVILRLLLSTYLKACQSNDKMLRQRTAPLLGFIIQRWGCWRIPPCLDGEGEPFPVASRSEAEAKVFMWMAPLVFQLLKETVKAKWIDGKEQLKAVLHAIVSADFASWNELDEVLKRVDVKEAGREVMDSERKFLKATKSHREMIIVKLRALDDSWMKMISGKNVNLRGGKTLSRIQERIRRALVVRKWRVRADARRLRDLLRCLGNRPGLWRISSNVSLATISPMDQLADIVSKVNVSSNDEGEDNEEEIGIRTIVPCTGSNMIRCRLVVDAEGQNHAHQAYGIDYANENPFEEGADEDQEDDEDVNADEDALYQDEDTGISFMSAAEVLSGLQELIDDGTDDDTRSRTFSNGFGAGLMSKFGVALRSVTNTLSPRSESLKKRGLSVIQVGNRKFTTTDHSLATSGKKWSDFKELERFLEQRQNEEFAIDVFNGEKMSDAENVSNSAGANSRLGFFFGQRSKEGAILILPADLIKPFKVVEGELRLFHNCVIYRGLRSVKSDTSDASTTNINGVKVFDEPVPVLVWPLVAVRGVRSRRYLLQRTALELFFDEGSSALFNFHTSSAPLAFFQRLRQLKPPRMLADIGNHKLYAPAQLVAICGWTEQWRQRKISNLEYLMRLNDAAGRTYHDLTQYPVMPWVIADYSSSTLDLKDPKTFRDLAKPIGALNPERLQRIVERFESFSDSEMPPFMYGSHYSSVGTVVYYLVRIEPYSSHALSMQGGKFDIPDRLFFGVGTTWENCLISPSDVKELTPEWFTIPEFLRNSNNLKLGIRQDKVPVGDVVLPPWAKGSPEDFIRLNRVALESDHVSNRLHHWIDLKFGFKQQGPEAVKAHNVFYYLTYEGNVDFRQIVDPVMRRAMETQIASFGQTPSQLFRSPHPRRMSQEEVLQARYPKASVDFKSLQVKKTDVRKTVVCAVKSNVVSLFWAPLLSAGDKSNSGNGIFYVLGDDGVVKGLRCDGNAIPIKLVPKKMFNSPTIDSNALKRSISSKAFCGIVPVVLIGKHRSRDKVLVSGGYWDGSLYTSTTGTIEPQLLQRITGLGSVCTCIAVGESEEWMAFGCEDGEVVLQRLHPNTDDCALSEIVLLGCGGHSRATGHYGVEYGGFSNDIGATSSGLFRLASRNSKEESTSSTIKNNVTQEIDTASTSGGAPPIPLCGHDVALSCISVSDSLGLVASGDVEGVCILHQLQPPVFVRVLLNKDFEKPEKVRAMTFLSMGMLVVLRGGWLHLLCVTGSRRTVLAEKEVGTDCLPHLVPSLDERFVLTGNPQQLVIRWMHTLEPYRYIEKASKVPISCFISSGDQRCVLVYRTDKRIVSYSLHWGIGGEKSPCGSLDADGSLYAASIPAVQENADVPRSPIEGNQRLNGFENEDSKHDFLDFFATVTSEGKDGHRKKEKSETPEKVKRAKEEGTNFNLMYTPPHWGKGIKTKETLKEDKTDLLGLIDDKEENENDIFDNLFS